MKWSCRGTLGPLLAVVCIAFCCSTLSAAQSNASSGDVNQAVTEQLQHMQQQLTQQQQQINQLQGELHEARQQLKAVSISTSSQPALVSASYSEPSAAAAVAAPPEGPPPAPTVIPAVAPLRVLPVDAPKTGGLIGLKIGPVTMRPYGFIKVTAARDDSNPNGDDFPFPGLFLSTTNPFSTGYGKDPTFFVKARSTRFGSNFEWPDISKNLTITGRVEGDFEGNFSEVDNRDVSSIRSSNPSLRLAFARLDYHASDTTDVYFEGGQDWTLFGSSVLPNILETTGLMFYSGAIYERSPQLLGGFVHTLTPNRDIKLSAAFGIMMPSSGQIEKLGALGLTGQIGQAEVQGADSGRPEVEGRVALQFQLDQAKGVAPAQIIVSGFQGRRRYNPNGALTGAEIAAISANPLSSEMYGGQVGVQLPTRWFTAVASAYRGGDMRFMFGGQINAFATNNCPAGTTTVTLATADGNPAATGPANLCETAAGAFFNPGEKPIRSFGGFAQLGFPLSRWFNANPEGRNAGWQLYFTFGKDQVVRRDLTNPNFTTSVGNLSPLPLLMGKVGSTTLYYKLNQFVTFGFEQSIYAARLAGNIHGSLWSGLAYDIGGKASNEWQDHRTEFGPIFTF